MFLNIQQNITVLLLLLFGSLQAQEAVNASGGDFSSVDGSVSYSVGLIAWNTIGNSNYLIEGVQQPKEISGPDVGIEELNLEMRLFPNPTNGFIQLILEDLPVNGLSYQLYDTQGKFLKQRELREFQNNIDLSTFSPGAYLLKVSDKQYKFKSFTIIKN